MANRIFRPLAYIIFTFLFMEILCRFAITIPTIARIIDNTETNAKYRLLWVRNNSGKRSFESHIALYNYDIYDPTKGWAIRPNARNVPASFRGTHPYLLNSNSKGIRGIREFTYEKLPGRKRILAIGDSFTFGDEVNDDETYPYYLQEILPRAEVLNLGVHGYGHDQILIHLREEGVKYKPDIIVLGFTYCDMDRNLNEFWNYAKPRFVLSGGVLKLKNSPVPTPEHVLKQELFRLKFFDLCEILFRAFLHRMKVEKYEKEKLTTAILDAITESAVNIGAKPVFVYMPYLNEMTDPLDGLTEGENYLCNYCKTRGVHYLSLRRYFVRRKNSGAILQAKGHYSPLENRIAAEAIGQYLAEMN